MPCFCLRSLSLSMSLSLRRVIENDKEAVFEIGYENGITSHHFEQNPWQFDEEEN